MRLYIVQAHLELGNVEFNKEKIFSYLTNARNGIALIPEMFSCGFDNENLLEHTKKTKTVRKGLEKISLENDLIVAGTLPKNVDGEIYNTGFVIDKGKLIYEQEKNKLFSLTNEQLYFAQGKEKFDVVESSFGKLGLLICFELRFPKISAVLRKKGAEVLLIPAQWGKGKPGKDKTHHFTTLLKARAIELQLFVIASNTVGKIDIEYAGHSSIYDPWGNELVCAENKEGLFSAKLDLEKVYRTRKEIPIEY